MWYLTAFAALMVLLLLTKKASGETIMEANKEVTLAQLIANYAKEFELPEALIKAIIKQESNWNINAKNPSDPSYGLMQIMPIVAHDAGLIADYKNVTPADIDKIMLPVNNLFGGCWLLHNLMKRHDMWTAVEMYNVGETGYLEKGYRNSMYVSKVKGYYEYYTENPNG